MLPFDAPSTIISLFYYTLKESLRSEAPMSSWKHYSASGMGGNSSAIGSLGNAETPTRKHDRPSDLHTECQGCQLGLSIDDGSHMCYTIAGPAFNRTRTSVDTDILRPVGSSTLFPFADTPTPPLVSQRMSLSQNQTTSQWLNQKTSLRK